MSVSWASPKHQAILQVTLGQEFVRDFLADEWNVCLLFS